MPSTDTVAGALLGGRRHTSDLNAGCERIERQGAHTVPGVKAPYTSTATLFVPQPSPGGLLVSSGLLIRTPWWKEAQIENDFRGLKEVLLFVKKISSSVKLSIGGQIKNNNYQPKLQPAEQPTQMNTIIHPR